MICFVVSGCFFFGIIFFPSEFVYYPMAVSNIFLFSSLIGEMIQFDALFFEMGWEKSPTR